MGLLDRGLVRFDPRIITPRKTTNGHLIACVRDQSVEDSLMDAASWKDKRGNPLTKGIVLILIAAVAVGILIFATLALVGLN
jgi:hypothetical protein